MTVEQRCFLELLRDCVHRRPSAPPAEAVDWAAVARYAEEQSLGGILYVQCRTFLPPDSAALRRLHRGFYSAVYGSVNGSAALAQAGKRLAEAGVPYLPFKGEVLRQYWPHPELRTMGDRDILVHDQGKEAADRVFLSLGYQKHVDNHAVWTYTSPTMMFEVHNVMFYEYLSNQVDYRSYFARVWDTAHPTGEAGAYAPEPNLHFLYLMCHTAKHIINNGMGFRAFLDMVFMTREERGLDWTFLEAELERLQLLDFTRTCFALCRRWFGVDMPLGSGVPEESFFEEVTDKAFRDGTFGLHNEQNEAAHSAKELSRAEAPYWQTALALTWRKLFPPYRDMQLVPWYHFVDGRPWLLPAAWVYRWFYTARHKFSQSKALLAEPFAKRSVIEERKQLIDRWGL